MKILMNILNTGKITLEIKHLSVVINQYRLCWFYIFVSVSVWQIRVQQTFVFVCVNNDYLRDSSTDSCICNVRERFENLHDVNICIVFIDNQKTAAFNFNESSHLQSNAKTSIGYAPSTEIIFSNDGSISVNIFISFQIWDSFIFWM